MQLQLRDQFANGEARHLLSSRSSLEFNGQQYTEYAKTISDGHFV